MADHPVTLSDSDSEFLTYLRGAGIIMIVLSHIGGMTVFPPYSTFNTALAPAFFFASGAGNYFSYSRTNSAYSYFSRRLRGLLVPYYLFCLVALCVFLLQNARLPVFDISALGSWLIIKPSSQVTPFPLAQLWFLRSLAMVILVSPLLFLGLGKFPRNTVVAVLIVLVLSSFQNEGLNSLAVRALGHDTYRSLFYCMFFVTGAIYYTFRRFFPLPVLFVGLFASVGVSVALVMFFDKKIAMTHHVEVPDLYFAASSTAVLSLFLMGRDVILLVIRKIPGLPWFLRLSNEQSLSIMMLHPLSIYICESFLGWESYSTGGPAYSVMKVMGMLLITFLLSVPLTMLANTVNARLFIRPRFSTKQMLERREQGEV